MPIYEYQCRACGREFTDEHPMTSKPVTYPCPHCGSRNTTRVYLPAVINLVGMDWTTKEKEPKGE